jgi:hypothetical protein
MGLAHNPNISVKHGAPSMSGKFAEAGESTESKRNPLELFNIPQSDNLRGGDINMRRRALPQLECDQKYASKLLVKHGTDYTVFFFDYINYFLF